MTERVLDLAPDAAGARAAAESARGMLADVDPESAFACELSVAEACANVVEHARSGRLRVVIRRSPVALLRGRLRRGGALLPRRRPGDAAPRGRAAVAASP